MTPARGPQTIFWVEAPEAPWAPGLETGTPEFQGYLGLGTWERHLGWRPAILNVKAIGA